MYTQTDLVNGYKTEFSKLGISSEDEMLGILNCVDTLAEIGYIFFNNELSSQEDDKEEA